MVMIGKFMDDRRDSKLETIALSRKFESSTMKHVGSFCNKLITQDVEALTKHHWSSSL